MAMFVDSAVAIEAILAHSCGEKLRCDVCGKFIALRDFSNGASRRMLTPDAYMSRETYETLCKTHGVNYDVSTDLR